MKEIKRQQTQASKPQMQVLDRKQLEQVGGGLSFSKTWYAKNVARYYYSNGTLATVGRL